MSTAEKIAMRLWLQIDDICYYNQITDALTDDARADISDYLNSRQCQTSTTSSDKISEENSCVPFDRIDPVMENFLKKHNFAGISYTEKAFQTVENNGTTYGLDSLEKISTLNRAIQQARDTASYSHKYYISVYQRESSILPSRLNLPTKLVANVGTSGSVSAMSYHSPDSSISNIGAVVGFQNESLGFTHYSDLTLDILDIPSNTQSDGEFFSTSSAKASQMARLLLSGMTQWNLNVIGASFPPRSSMELRLDFWWSAVGDRSTLINKYLSVLKEMVASSIRPDFLRITDMCSDIDLGIMKGDICPTCQICTPAMMSQTTIQSAVYDPTRCDTTIEGDSEDTVPQLCFSGLTITTPLYQFEESVNSNDISNWFTPSSAIVNIFDAGVDVVYGPMQFGSLKSLCSHRTVDGCAKANEGSFGDFDAMMLQLVKWYECQLQPRYSTYIFAGQELTCRVVRVNHNITKADFDDVVKKIIWHKQTTLLERGSTVDAADQPNFDSVMFAELSLLPIAANTFRRPKETYAIEQCNNDYCFKASDSQQFDHIDSDGNILAGVLDRNVIFIGESRDTLEVALFEHLITRGLSHYITDSTASTLMTPYASAVHVPHTSSVNCINGLFYELSKNKHHVLVLMTSDVIVSRIAENKAKIVQMRRLVKHCPSAEWLSLVTDSNKDFIPPCYVFDCHKYNDPDEGEAMVTVEQLWDVLLRYQRSINPNVKVVIVSSTGTSNNYSYFWRPEIYIQTWTATDPDHRTDSLDEIRRTAQKKWNRVADYLTDFWSCETENSPNCIGAMNDQAFIQAVVKKLTTRGFKELIFHARTPYDLYQWKCWNHAGHTCSPDYDSSPLLTESDEYARIPQVVSSWTSPTSTFDLDHLLAMSYVVFSFFLIRLEMKTSDERNNIN
eukprot:GHVH01015589.1.p1 GENE.GHVH01015589.1~~GHVH01015589.1.p1  ORF type:complete len:934 (+),score=116.38 GHVH01015589.1:105-2804(+)